MRKLYSFFFLLLTFCISAQTKVRVFDSRDEFRIQNAKVLDDKNNFIGYTNEIGELEINSSISIINVESENYIPQTVKINNSKLAEVFLDAAISLSTAEFYSNDSIARAFVKKVIKQQSKNSLSKADSYFFQSYTKFWSTVEQDSLRLILNPRDKKDSTINTWRKFLNQSHIFLSEKGMDHKFSKKYGTKNIIKSTRISGLQTPIYELDAMQPVLINLDQSKFDFFFKNIENPISNEGLNYYRYKIIGDFDYNGRTTTMVGFTPRQKLNKRQLRGEFWIDEKSKALVKIIAENTDEQFYADFDAEWTLVDDRWFPLFQMYRMESGYLGMDGILIDKSNQDEDENGKLWIFHQVQFKNVKTPVHFKSNEFSGYTTEAAFENNTIQKREEVLSQYRNDFSEKDNLTYVKMDSISSKYNIESKLKLMRIIQKGGKLELGKVDLDLTKVIAYNNFEGFRLGAALNTNEKWSTNYSLNAYSAYGLKDETLKFGFGGDYFINKPYSGRLFVNYYQDVSASGNVPQLLQSNFTRFVNGTLKNLYNNQFYSYKKYSAGYEQDIFSNLTFNVSMNYENQKNEFLYQYEEQNEWIENYNTQLALRWAPKTQYLRTPYGRVTVKQGQSVFYILGKKYWKIGDSPFNAFKLNVNYSDVFETALGKSQINASAGAVFGEMSLMNLYEGMGNAKNKPVFQNFGISTSNTFETMLPGEFYSDRYVSFHLKHIFFGVRLGNKVVLPQFVYRGILGDLNHKQNHRYFEFNTLNNYFHETGVEVNNILLKNFGLGVYYRLGAYSLPKFEENLHVKLTFNLNLF